VPEIIPLSESVVAVLRFGVKGLRWPVRDSNRDAFQEPVAAGIMEPDGADYRFTEERMKHREAILARAAERAERKRYEPPDGDLSEAARERLGRY
jgi:hypothetical protein